MMRVRALTLAGLVLLSGRGMRLRISSGRGVVTATILLSLLLAACSSEFRGDPEETRPDYAIAIIKNRWTDCPFCIEEISTVGEDQRIVFQESRDGSHDPIKMLPGRYRICALAEYPKSRASFCDEAELEAGHVYVMQREVCWFLCQITTGRAYASSTIWLEDLTTGRVVAGEKW